MNGTSILGYPILCYKRNLGFPIRLDLWLFQEGCQIAVSTDVGLAIHTDLGFADNNYCF